MSRLSLLTSTSANEFSYPRCGLFLPSTSLSSCSGDVFLLQKLSHVPFLSNPSLSSISACTPHSSATATFILHENVDNIRMRMPPARCEEDEVADSIGQNQISLPALQSASPEVFSEDGDLIIAIREHGSQTFNTIRVSCSVLEKASAVFGDMIQAPQQDDGRRYVVCEFEDAHAGRCMFAALHGVSCGEPEAKTIIKMVQYSIAYEVEKALAPLLSGWCEAQLERLSPGPWRDDHTLMLLAAQHFEDTPLFLKLVELANLKPEGSVIKGLDVESRAIYKRNIEVLSEMFLIKISSAATFIKVWESPGSYKVFSTNYFSCGHCERQGTDRVCAECGQEMPLEHDVCTWSSREDVCTRAAESIGIVALSGGVSVFLADQIVKAFSELGEKVEHECSGGDACPLRLHFAVLPEKLDAIAKASEKILEVELSKGWSEPKATRGIICGGASRVAGPQNGNEDLRL